MQTFTASDGRRIAFTDQGAGPPVLCLAGLTRDSRDFADLAGRLAAQYRVVTMDYRGRGASEWAADPLAEYTLPVEGRDALELLAHLGLGPVTVIGTSRGGLIGMGLAAQMPEAIRALVLNDVGPVLEESGLAFILTYLGRAPDFESFAAAGDALARLYAESFPGIDRAGWEAYARRTFAEEAGRPTLSYDPRLREAVEAAMAEPFPDLWPLYEAIGCPILALRGANSELLSAETLAEMTARHAATTAVTVPDRGHVPFLDEPAVLAALLPFLEAHAP